ncbi:hypothetical protein ABMA28_008007 [Loxostege sticticalis]|uniref:CCHC-type domain-containing protein n=1 Tax=Loxostege sticticalis TaxID=481309 RepID=A0ABD0SHX7_LOXSC
MAECKKTPQGGKGAPHPIPRGAAAISDTSGATSAPRTLRSRNLGTEGLSRPTRGEGEASSQEPSDRGSSAKRDCGEPGSGTAGARLVIDVNASSDEELNSDDERMMQALDESILSGHPEYDYPIHSRTTGHDIDLGDDDCFGLPKVAKFNTGRGGLKQTTLDSKRKKKKKPVPKQTSMDVKPEPEKTVTESVMDVAAGLHEEVQLIIDLADGLPKTVPDGIAIELQNAAQSVATIGQKLLANFKAGPKTENQEIQRLETEIKSLYDRMALQKTSYVRVIKHQKDQEDKFEEQIEKLRAENNSYCKELVSLRSAIHGHSGDAMNCDDSDLAGKYAVLSAENKDLQAQMAVFRGDNARLEEELRNLKSEMRRSLDAHRPPVRLTAAVSTQTSEISTAGSSSANDGISDDAAFDAFTASMLRQIGDMIDAKLDARLPPAPTVRPPLKTDVEEKARVAPTISAEGNNTKPRKIKNAATKPLVPVPTVTPTPAHSISANPSSSAWTEVVKRGKGGKGKGKSQAQAPAAQPEKTAQAKPTTAKGSESKKLPRLRVPKTAAVVLQLDPEAKSQDADFCKLLRDAKAKIDVQEMGLEGRLRTRSSRVTGNRIFEISAKKEEGITEASEKADVLAAAFSGAFPPGLVRVSRPEKLVDVRLSGFDETTTTTDIAEAVAKLGQCPSAQIKVGRITASGSVVVRCPVLVAKTLLKTRRVLVGWISARVALLPLRPARCSRCLGSDHGRGNCKSAEDRSSTCMRCGETGHKAAECTGEIRCCLCAEAGVSANHRIGTKNCPRPKKAVKEKPPEKSGTREITGMSVDERSSSSNLP